MPKTIVPELFSGAKKGIAASGYDVFEAFFRTLLALVIAHLCLPDFLLLGASALITFSLRDCMSSLLEENKKAIWDDKLSPYIANSHITARFVVLFVSIFFAAFLFHLFLNPSMDQALSGRFQNDFSELMQHNFEVLIAFAAFAFLYKDAGLMFILAWNALHWASSISAIFLIFYASGFLRAVAFIGAIAPHLICEATAYILAGMAGVFLSKAFDKYKMGSIEFRRVLKASLVILAISVFILFLSVCFEVFLAQGLFSKLLPA